MKKITIVIIAVSFCIASTASAGDNGYMISRMWDRQSIGIDGVIACLKNDCQPMEYKEHLLMIVSAETNLLAYGVSPKDDRLVSRLASDVRSISDLPVFSYKLFKKRLYELTGFTPSPEGSFKDNSFRVNPNGDTGTNKIIVSFK